MKHKVFVKHLLIFFIPIFMLILIILFFIFYSFQRSLKADINKQTCANLTLIKESVDTFLTDSTSLKMLIDLNPQVNLTILKMLSSNQSISYIDMLERKQLQPYIVSRYISKLYVNSIYIYMGTGDSFLLNGEIKSISEHSDRDWFGTFAEKDSEVSFWTMQREIKNYAFSKTTIPVVSIFQRIKHDGVIVINLENKYFSNIIDSTNSYDDQSIIILNENNEPIFQNTNSRSLPWNVVESFLEKANTTDGQVFSIENHHVTQVYSKQNGFRYVSFIPNKVIYSTVNYLMKSVLISTIISFFISYLLAYYFSRVTQKFLDVQLSQRKYMLLSAQLSALQYQINPHFLFNSLQSIDLEVMKVTKTPTAANKIIANLSDIVRYSLDDPLRDVKLSDEIEITKSYIDIQRYRYDNHFNVIWEYQDDALSLSIVRLILQPIIENSLYHGSNEHKQLSLIKIKLYVKDDFLHFAIIDNGIGMTKERLKGVRASLLNIEENDSHEHIGLINIQKRLILKYGVESCLIIRSRMNIGTIVLFKIKKSNPA